MLVINSLHTKISLDKRANASILKGMKIEYDHKGLGITEMTVLGLTHPVFFVVVFWLTQHNMESAALRLARLVI